MIRLEQARLDRRLSVDDLAEATGISSRTIYRLEARQGGAWDETLFKLADYLDVRPSDLLRPIEEEEAAA